MYRRCGEQYRFRYKENIKLPPGIAMLKGTGVHGGSKLNWTQKIRSGNDLPRKDIIDASISCFEEEQKKGFELSGEEKAIGKDNVISTAKDSIVTLSGLYADDVAPAYQPVKVEEKLVLETFSPEYDLLAYVDMVDKDTNLVDLKTTRRKKQQAEADNSIQLSFYAYIYKALTGKLPKSVCLETLVEKKQPERQCLKSTRTDEDMTIILERINAMIDGVKKGVFISADPSDWCCSPTYCGYYNLCKYVKKGLK
jgi:hypothetical protein